MTPHSSNPWPHYGWLGLALVAICWPLNWLLTGLRTHLLFFPLWTGLTLVFDALVWRRRGDSLLTRNRWAFLGLFVVSVPVWWLFELLNARTQNWHYLGREHFSDLEYGLLASLTFSTVIPAVFSAAEWVATWPTLARWGNGPRFPSEKRTASGFFVAGWLMLLALHLWPRYGFAFTWLSLYFILEPINVWLGLPSLVDRTRQGDWRPVGALWGGVLLCAFFWEFWNYWSYPKWVYTVPFVDFWHVFEMPLLGYGGYLPFALELFAIYHLSAGLLGRRPYLKL